MSLFIPIGVALVIGMSLGAQMAFIVPQNIIFLIFGTVLLLVSIRMASTKIFPVEKDHKTHEISKLITFLSSVVILIGGIISGLIGIGGGIIMIPTLIVIAKLPIRQVSIYSNMAITLGSFTAVLTYLLRKPDVQIFLDPIFAHLQFGYINLGIAILPLLGSFFTSKLGVKLNQKISPNKIKWPFAALLLLFSLKFFLQAFFPGLIS